MLYLHDKLSEAEYWAIDMLPAGTGLERVRALHQKMVAIRHKFKAHRLVRSPEYVCTRSRLLIKTSMKEITVATDRHTNELAALFVEYQVRQRMKTPWKRDPTRACHLREQRREKHGTAMPHRHMRNSKETATGVGSKGIRRFIATRRRWASLQNQAP